MVRIDKDYVFQGPEGEASLLDLFDGRRQLIVLANFESYKERMGWIVPWFSSFGSDFNVDFGVTTDDRETFALSVFLCDGDRVFRTYFTSGLGVEALGSSWTFLDLTPLGRQETWEGSPDGYRQTPPYEWWRRHDEYADAGS